LTRKVFSPKPRPTVEKKSESVVPATVAVAQFGSFPL